MIVLEPWSISPERWGEGLAPEAGGACLDWAFDVAELDRVVSFTMRDNIASRRVMEKLGLRYSHDFERKGFGQVLYELDAAERWIQPPIR